MRLYLLITVAFVLTLVTSTSYAVDIYCSAKSDSKGWIPDEFHMRLADDRRSGTVISPISETFGEKPFKSGLFGGSTLFSTGKGKSSSHEYYSYEIAFSLYQNDTVGKIKITVPTYRPLTVMLNCSKTQQTKDVKASGRKTLESDQTQNNVTNLNSLQQRLEEAKQVYESGLITEKEYQELKKKILDL